MKETAQLSHVIRFESFEVNLRSGELYKNGEKIKLQEQAFQILTILLEQPGEVILRNQIQRRLWPNDTVVEFENSINAAVKRLRLALGDSADCPRYIQTLARRGYRWQVPIQRVAASANLHQNIAKDGSSSPAEVAASYLIGKKVSHYRVLEVVGGGGMGLVYKAEDLKLGRRVALKFLPEEMGSDPQSLQRFEREARTASSLNHPNICTIYEFGEHEGQPFIVMELLEGKTLREFISSGAEGAGLPLPNLLNIAIQVAEGLNAAHQIGIIHRDVKPANIFVNLHGQVKILDFGLATLAPSATGGASEEVSEPHPHGSKAQATEESAIERILTRTGLQMGTAGYMSPEQARGEKLDARTDIFNFGLVIYEMATGQRAFSGNTAAILKDAILNRPPLSVHKLNSRIPPELEYTIDKALQKERETRYQGASEMREDLEFLKQKIERKHSPRWRYMAAGLITLILIASITLWFAKLRTVRAPALPELQLRQLTANSADDAVGSGLISPDGKYVAYTDANRVLLQNIQTGESQAVPQPVAPKDGEQEWELGAWFPDSSRFLLNSHPPGQDPNYWNSEGSSIWTVSVLGGASRKLRDNAVAYRVSPDGSLISFGTNKGRLGDRQIWLMGPSGEQARELYGEEEDSISGLRWSWDAKHVIYAGTGASGDTLVSRDLAGGPPISLLSPSEATRLKDYVWLPDGRLIYSLVEEHEDFGEGACNIWQMRLDANSGKPVEKSKRVTNWPKFCIDYLSATTDGKRLVFRESVGHITTYMADLKAGGRRVANAKHFTLTDSWDLPADWTADGNSLLFLSNRTGYYGIYKQALNESTAKLLVPGTAGLRNPRMSADGHWVMYLRQTRPEDPSSPRELLRVPVAGGLPEVVFTTRPGSSILRARSPSDLCAIAEPSEDHKQLTITTFDPLKGRGSELTRFALDPTNAWAVDLSPDGTHIAALLSPKGPIQILSLRGQATREIKVKRWKNLGTVDWAANGRGLFVSNGIQHGAVLLHVDLEGDAQVLFKNHGGMWSPGLPSPNGRHLAILSSPWESNLWMMEHF